jgi:hypothetical protein
MRYRNLIPMHSKFKTVDAAKRRKAQDCACPGFAPAALR